jgi:hypothetical protein
MVIGRIMGFAIKRYMRDFTYNPNVKVRNVIVRLRSSIDTLEFHLDRFKKSRKEILKLNNSIQSTQSLINIKSKKIKGGGLRGFFKRRKKKKETLGPKELKIQAEIDKYKQQLSDKQGKKKTYMEEEKDRAEAVESVLKGLFDSLKEGHLIVLTMLHRARNDANEIIHKFSKHKLIPEDGKKYWIDEVNNKVKKKMIEISHKLYLKAKSQRTKTMSQFVVEEGITSLRSPDVLLRRIRQSSIEIDKYEDDIQRVMKNPIVGNIPHLITHWREQLEEIEEIGEHFKTITHQVHKSIAKINKYTHIKKSEARFKKSLKYAERQSWYLWNDVKIKPYKVKKVTKPKLPKKPKVIAKTHHKVPIPKPRKRQLEPALTH